MFESTYFTKFLLYNSQSFGSRSDGTSGIGRIGGIGDIDVIADINCCAQFTRLQSTTRITVSIVTIIAIISTSDIGNSGTGAIWSAIVMTIPMITMTCGCVT